MLKNKIAIAVMGAAAILALAASIVSAQNDEKKSEVGPAMKMTLQINASGHAQLGGTIAAIQGGSMTVTSWGGIWTVNIGSDAKIVRRFGGASNISEFQAGDYVTVTGTINGSASWTIDAKTVRNMSIQTRNAYFSGSISNLSGNSFTLTTKARGDMKVTLTSDAKITVNGKKGTASDLANGMRATVSGVWDRTKSTILADKVTARTPKTATQTPHQ